MWQNIIVAKRRDYRYREGLVGSVGSSEDLLEFLYYPSIRTQDLVRISGDLLVTIMSCRIACPYYEINVVLDIIPYPFEGFIYQTKWRVAVRGLCAIDPRRPRTSMAGVLFFCRGMNFVELIGMQI